MRAILMLGTLLGHVPNASGQEKSVWSPGVADVGVVGTAAALFLAPGLFNINDHPPSCAPCTPGTLPWFDRWAVGVPHGTLSKLSTGLIAGQALVTWWDLGRGREWGRVAASVESLAWAIGTTELLKAVTARHRPVLYTAGAVAASTTLDNQRSFPSSNTASAFALATSYWLNRKGRDRTTARWVVLATAATVGVLRVAAHRHFPSDVVGGAVVGVVSAVGVQLVRF